MRICYLFVTYAIITLFLSITAAAQGNTCAEVQPFCTDSGVTFPAGINVPEASITDPGNNYGCLLTQPNPAWYYLQIAENGSIDILQTNSNSVDVDFALWGPFDSLSDANEQCGSLGNPIDCSYSASAVENINIPNNQVGGVYILLITNYSNQPTEINAVQNGGTGVTNCSILCGLNAEIEAPLWVCNGGTLNLNVTVDSIDANTTYAWTGPNGFSSTLQNPSIPNMGAAQSGEYSVVVTIGDCYTDPITATVNALNPTVLPTVNSPVCAGSTIDFVTAAVQVSPATIFTWTGPNGFTGNGQLLSIPNATTEMNGTYTVVANDAGCLSQPASVELMVSGIEAQASPPQEVCAGAMSASVSVSAQDGIAPYTYLWSSGEIDSLLTEVGNGSYQVTVTDAANCTATAAATVTVFPPFETSITGKFDFCEGKTAQLEAGDFAAYLWSNEATSATINPDTAGVYTVTVTDNNGCTGIATQTVIQNPNPTPSIEGNLFILPNSLTELNAGNNFVSYVWSNGDITPSINVGTKGEYSVTVTDSNTCTGTASANVIQVVAIIPTAFSPNNDSVNDELRIVSNNSFINQIKWSIFNRWGEKVFETNDITEAWDGTHKGQEVPNGVYAYYAEVTFINEQAQIYQGNVTVVR